MLLVFTQDGVPTWEIRRRDVIADNDLVASGTADTFEAEAAKAAALFEASERSHARLKVRTHDRRQDHAHRANAFLTEAITAQQLEQLASLMDERKVESVQLY